MSTQRVIRGGGGALLLLLVSGCSWFSWLPFVDGGKKVDPAKAQKPAPLVRFDAEVRIDRQWRVSVGEGLGKKYLKLHPAVIADQIFAGDGYGMVAAYDRFSGKRKWRSQIGKANGGGFFSFGFFDRKDHSFVGGGVGVGDGKVFIGTTAGEVIALGAADGSEQWRTAIGSEVLSTPIFGDDKVFAQTIDGRLIALEAENGKVLWSFDNQVPVLTLRGTATPVYDNGVVYTGFASGKVSAVRSDSGEPIWESRIMLPEGRSELERIVDVDGRPVILGPVLVAASYQGRVKALRLTDGQSVWERETSSYQDLDEGYGNVYLVDDGDVITALDLETADEVWQQKGFARRRLTAPLAFSNYVLVGDEEGYLHVIAQSDGRMLGRRRIDSDGLRSAPIVADGVVYVLGNSGSLSALEIIEK